MPKSRNTSGMHKMQFGKRMHDNTTIVRRKPPAEFAHIPSVLGKKTLTSKEETMLRDAAGKLAEFRRELSIKLSDEGAANPKLNDQLIWAGDTESAIRRRIRVD